MKATAKQTPDEEEKGVFSVSHFPCHSGHRNTVVVGWSYHRLFWLPGTTLGIPVSGGSPVPATCLSLWCLCAESVCFPSPECYQFRVYLSVEEVGRKWGASQGVQRATLFS